MDILSDSVFVTSVNLGKICLQVYDLTTGMCTRSFRGSCAGSHSLCAVGPSDYLISALKDKPLLQAWMINQHDPLQIRLTLPGRVTVMSVDEASSEYCAVGICEKIYIYQLNSGLQLGVINSHYQSVSCLQFTPCGNYFASAGDDGFVYLWSLSSLINSLHKADRPQVQPYYILGQHSDKVTDLCISEGGMRGILVTSSLDYTAKVFELVTGRLRHNIIASSGLTAVLCNALSSQLFIAGERGKIWGLNILPHRGNQDVQAKDEGSQCHEGIIQHMRLSTSGDMLVTGATDGDIKVWSIVMSEKKSGYGTPTLALQRTLHSGRGAVTNIIIKRIDKEIFNFINLSTYNVITPFNSQATVDVLDAVITVPVRKEKLAFDPEEFYDLAANLQFEGENLDAVESKKKKKKVEYCEEERKMEQQGSEIEFLAYVRRMKQANEELYKVAMKHLIGED